MAPPFVACRICRRVEGRLKNYTDSQFIIKAYEKLTGCPFLEVLYLTKFCPKCACQIRKSYKFRKTCQLAHYWIIDYLRAGRKISKRYIQQTGACFETTRLTPWNTNAYSVRTVDLTHNPRAYKSKKKSEVEGIIDIKHVTVPKDPTAEIPIKAPLEYSDPEDAHLNYVSDSENKPVWRDYQYLVECESPTRPVSPIIDRPQLYESINNREAQKNGKARMNIRDAYIRKEPASSTYRSPYDVLFDRRPRYAPVNDLEAPMNDLEPPMKKKAPMTTTYQARYEAPVNDLVAPINDLEPKKAPMTTTYLPRYEAPVNVLEAPMKNVESQLNKKVPSTTTHQPGYEAPMNESEAPINALDAWMNKTRGVTTTRPRNEAPMNVMVVPGKNLEAPMIKKAAMTATYRPSYEAPMNDLEASMNDLQVPMKNVEARTNRKATMTLKFFDAAMNVLKAPVNNSEEEYVSTATVNDLEASMNVSTASEIYSEASMNVSEVSVNDLEASVNNFQPVLCEPDAMVNEEKEIEVKIEEITEDISDDPADDTSVKLESESDPDDLTLYEIQEEMREAGQVERKRKKTERKKDKETRTAKKSELMKTRRNRSNEELGDNFTITQFVTEEEQMQEFLKRREGEGYLEGKYKCELCLKSFKEQKWMDAHVKKHEPAAGSYECGICKIRCRTPKLFRTHRDCNHTTRYSCRRCDYTTYSKAQALKHHGWHEGVEHTCQHCGATFRKHTTYMGHLRRAHPSAHICGACARSFVSAYGLNLHVKAVHKEITNPGPDSTRCEDCDVTFVSRQMYTRHLLITDSHKDISKHILGCRKCGEQFDTKEEMERHTHYKERKYVRKDVPRRSIQCDQCSEVFSHPNGVYQHYLRAHPDTPYRFAVCRRYLCEQCGKTFKSPGLLQQHALSHLGLRPPPSKQPPGRNACRLCGKTYSKLSGLFRHKLTHMGVRRHKCHICEKAFTDTSNLKQHVQGVHLNIRRIRKR